MRRTKSPSQTKNASDKNDKLEDCDEKRELPIKAAFARKAASNHSPLEFGNRVLIQFFRLTSNL